MRADLLRRLGRPTDALPHYRRALERAASDPERRYLQRHFDELAQLTGASSALLRCLAWPAAKFTIAAQVLSLESSSCLFLLEPHTTVAP